MNIRRRSCEILEDFRNKVGIDKLADALRLSKITIYKWCEPSKTNPEDLPFEPSGRENPFDRTATILHSMVAEGQTDLAVESINFLARELGGVFIQSDDLDSILKTLLKAQSEEKKKK